jgi:hypothetical protein
VGWPAVGRLGPAGVRESIQRRSQRAWGAGISGIGVEIDHDHRRGCEGAGASRRHSPRPCATARALARARARRVGRVPTAAGTAGRRSRAAHCRNEDHGTSCQRSGRSLLLCSSWVSSLHGQPSPASNGLDVNSKLSIRTRPDGAVPGRPNVSPTVCRFSSSSQKGESGMRTVRMKLSCTQN